VKAYLDMVYEEYARRFPEHMGTTIKLTVADHEGTYGVQIAWTPKLWEEFQKRQGFDLRPGCCCSRTIHPTGPVPAACGRRTWRPSPLCTLRTSPTGPNWCTRHGIKHATSLYEEQMFIQVDQPRHVQAVACRTGVFVDALLERSRTPIDFKEAVSVAHFDGKPFWIENQGLQVTRAISASKRRALALTCACCGAPTRCSPTSTTIRR
jgi:hypothetical protein